MGVEVKICGLTRAPDVAAAVAAGAAYVGFVFFAKSPRHLSVDAARQLALAVPPSVRRVGLVVDADMRFLTALVRQVPLEMLQLHGNESPTRVAEVRQATSLPIIKAIGIAQEEDLAQIATYGRVADHLLVDARPPAGAQRPGGHGRPFDWSLLEGQHWPCPWMLAGGLTAESVAQAIAASGARRVDVSSGVESAPAHKDASKIAAFIQAAQGQRVLPASP